jgi:hypothetical protein
MFNSCAIIIKIFSVFSSVIGDGTVVQGKPANSCTSKEHSDDEGDLEENTDPASAKRVKRYCRIFHLQLS